MGRRSVPASFAPFYPLSRHHRRACAPKRMWWMGHPPRKSVVDGPSTTLALPPSAPAKAANRYRAEPVHELPPPQRHSEPPQSPRGPGRPQVGAGFAQGQSLAGPAAAPPRLEGAGEHRKVVGTPDAAAEARDVGTVDVQRYRDVRVAVRDPVDVAGRGEAGHVADRGE